MRDALIGHTGFVGSTLRAQRRFESLYNSQNFRAMTGQRFHTVVCAGVSAVKWKANQQPDEDWARIAELQNVLSTITAERFILISTIDVYPLIQGKDESFDCHSQPNHAYGTHRLRFEDSCLDHFPACTIVRLPGLFGPGLRKNVIFDLLNRNCLDAINPGCSFQYYPLPRLWSDISRVLEAEIPLVNLFSEPVKTSVIHDRFFPELVIGQKPGAEVHYDLHTTHARLWQKEGPYILSSDEVLDELRGFVENYDVQP